MDDYRSLIKGVLRTASTEEFLAPGIGACRENYEALKELYLELWERLKDSNTPRFLNDVKRDLRAMDTNLAEAKKGASLEYDLFSRERIDKNIRYLAYVERWASGTAF